jgi:hypothetical protein
VEHHPLGATLAVGGMAATRPKYPIFLNLCACALYSLRMSHGEFAFDRELAAFHGNLQWWRETVYAIWLSLLDRGRIDFRPVGLGRRYRWSRTREISWGCLDCLLAPAAGCHRPGQLRAEE